MKSLLFSFLLLTYLGCSSTDEKPEKRHLKDYQAWGYQLQNYENYTRLFKTRDTVWVIDLYRQAGEKWDAKDLEKVKFRGNLLLSYFSIGEAEGYRPYYKKMPKDLLIAENKNWKENFKVKYWDQRWKKILWGSNKAYLDQIIEQGFEGVYLDIVDAFESFQEKEKKKRANQMADLIIEISKYARSKVPGFYIVSQNGSNIISYLSPKKRDLYFKHVDALAQEDLYFLGKKPMNNNWNPQKYLIPFVKEFQKAGKKVFVVEYVNRKSKVLQFFKAAKSKGFTPLVAERSLSGKLLISKPKKKR